MKGISLITKLKIKVGIIKILNLHMTEGFMKTLFTAKVKKKEMGILLRENMLMERKLEDY